MDDVAALRLEIFRAYPYLYDGRRDDELRYLRRYTETPGACLALADDSGTIVGAASGIPLTAEELLLQAAFAESVSCANTYYIGELLLYHAYRGSGLGSRLFGRLETFVRSRHHYRYLGCATVVRPDNHPLRPPDHIPIERFLKRHGFAGMNGPTPAFNWRETDGILREHPMRLWLKEVG